MGSHYHPNIGEIGLHSASLSLEATIAMQILISSASSTEIYTADKVRVACNLAESFVRECEIRDWLRQYSEEDLRRTSVFAGELDRLRRGPTKTDPYGSIIDLLLRLTQPTGCAPPETPVPDANAGNT